MTIPSTPRKAGPLLGNGVQTSWPFTFKVFADTDILVTVADNLGIESELTLTSDYTVTLNSNQETSPGGTVTYLLPDGYTLVITGDIDYDQPLDLPSGGAFSPTALENELDRLTMQIQQLREAVNRAVQAPITSNASGYLPSPQSNTLIGWNESETAMQNFPLSEIATGIAFATYRYDTYTGDGTTTSFVLSADPVTLGNIDVSVDGQTYVPGVDHTLAAQHLVFTVAPADGVEILARYGQGMASGVSGDALDISYQPAGVGAELTTVEAKLKEFVSVKDFGAVGDGVTDDTAAIQAAIDAVSDASLRFPDGVYKVTETLNVTCNVMMDPVAYLAPAGMAAGAVVYDVTERTRHENVRVEGVLATDPANGTIGIRVSGLSASRSTFVNCSAINCKYGAVVRTFSVTLDDCRFNYNTCNLSMSAASAGVQINDNRVRGGNHSGPLGNYAIKIGDPDFSTTVAAGQPHGAGISLNGFAVDGGTIKVDSAVCVSIGTAEPIYHENPASGIGLELGTAGQDDYVGGVEVGPCFYNTMEYAVFCNAGIKSLDVHPSTYTSVTKCALYVMTDIYPFSYRSGKSVSSFTLAPEVHTGRRHATYTSHDFTYVTLPSDGVIAGIQAVLNEPDWQFAQAEWKEGQTLKRSSPTEYGYGRRYKTPTTGKAGSLNSYLFTFTTASDAKFYNGGDEYDAGALGGGVIDRVDYETGIAYLSDSLVGAPTGGTISQNTSAWISETRTTTGAAPASGTWAKGDKCDNANPSVGSPKGWICTVSGTPGTWVSTGNL